MPEDSDDPESGRRRWRILVVLAVFAALVAGAASVLLPTPDARDAEPSAVPALRSVVLPGDVEGLLALLAAMPDEVAGRERVPDRPDGEVLYADDREEQLFVVAMESADMGVRNETNSELLEIEARRADRAVTAQQTEPSAPMLYVAGTEANGTLHFLLWTTPDNPFVFAAGADSADHLDALLRAFAGAAG